MISRRVLCSAPKIARQKGVVLFIALIVLVAMTMIGIAIIRQGSMGQIIVGNLAFREEATAAADRGVEAARNWLVSQAGATLEASVSGQGYVANGLASAFDPFANSAWAPTLLDSQGNSIVYVIHRLCPEVGKVTSDTNLCIVYSGGSSSKEGVDYVNRATESLQPYYRVTVRVAGPRNTTSYIQTILY